MNQREGDYACIRRRAEAFGLVARGGFHPRADDAVPVLADGRPARTVVLVGNVGDAPWPPFVAWARRAEPVTESPIGILVHPDYGLWHAYRGAMLLDRAITLPAPGRRPPPCDTCPDQPCRRACPVGQQYNYPRAQQAPHLDAFLVAQGRRPRFRDGS